MSVAGQPQVHLAEGHHPGLECQDLVHSPAFLSLQVKILFSHFIIIQFMVFKQTENVYIIFLCVLLFSINGIHGLWCHG